MSHNSEFLFEIGQTVFHRMSKQVKEGIVTAQHRYSSGGQQYSIHWDDGTYENMPALMLLMEKPEPKLS